MKRLLCHCCGILMLAVFSNCADKPQNPETTAAPKDRNMFGMYIQRGLIKNSDGLEQGYFMFAVPNSPFTYLINRKGEVVHSWKGNYGAFNAYLMDDGSLVQGAFDPDYPVFGFGGPYGRIQKLDWDSRMVWDYEHAAEKEIVHHDISVMPNGNILAIVYDAVSFEEAVALGRDPEKLPRSGAWLEKIIEIEPDGPRGGKVIWEWRLADHLVQNRDAAIANFGEPADHPELIDVNLGLPIPPPMHPDTLAALKAKNMAGRNQTTDNLGSDIWHLNAIDYNPKLDQIVLSSPQINEIFIIDHSATTEEVKTHKGGRSGKGGDVLYRWGNPANYGRGDSTSRKLFGQHDVRWIEEGKPGAGHLTLFNNHPPGDIDWEAMNTSSNYSEVLELETPIDENGGYTLSEDGGFGPEQPAWKYMAPDTLSFYSAFISGASRLKNGNTLICEGARGRFLEVRPDGEVVWEYLNPYRGNIHQPNGDPVNPMFLTYSQFRVTYVPATHPALQGRELKPLDPQPEPFHLPPPAEKSPEAM